MEERESFFLISFIITTFITLMYYFAFSHFYLKYFVL